MQIKSDYKSRDFNCLCEQNARFHISIQSVSAWNMHWFRMCIRPTDMHTLKSYCSVHWRYSAYAHHNNNKTTNNKIYLSTFDWCVFFLSHAFVVSFHLSSFIFSVDIASFSVQLPLFALTYDSFCGLFDLDDFFFIMVAIVILCLVNSQFFCSE